MILNIVMAAVCVVLVLGVALFPFCAKPHDYPMMGFDFDWPWWRWRKP